MANELQAVPALDRLAPEAFVRSDFADIASHKRAQARILFAAASAAWPAPEHAPGHSSQQN